MANWKDVSATEDVWVYKGYNYKNKLYIVLQYDADAVSPTKASVRFALRRDTDYNYFDGFCVLFNPTSNDRTINVMKPATPTNNSVAWKNYYSAPFTVSKKYSDEKFPLPDFWYVNTGRQGTLIQQAAIDGDADELYSYVKDSGVMGGYKTKFPESAWKIDPSNTIATLGSSPTITAQDKGDNSCLVYGTLGKGENNKLESATLYYTLDGTDPSGGGIRQYIELPASAGSFYEAIIPVKYACTVKAYVECKFKYNTTAASASAPIIYYVAPGAPGVPVLTTSKNRLTIKEPWTFTWQAATKGNNDSPVAGYYIMLLRKAKDGGDYEFIRNIYTEGDYLKISPGANPDDNTNYFTYRENSSCTLILQDPTDFGFGPGDRVKLRLRAFARNGAKQVLQGPIVDSADDYLIQNAGIVRVKVGTNWIEGQVYVKVGTVWTEAETVSARVNGKWEESE